MALAGPGSIGQAKSLTFFFQIKKTTKTVGRGGFLQQLVKMRPEKISHLLPALEIEERLLPAFQSQARHCAPVRIDYHIMGIVVFTYTAGMERIVSFQ
jgi:hypothetical protein